MGLCRAEEAIRIGYDGDAYLGLDKCVDFEKEVWFKFGEVYVEEAPKRLPGTPEIR